MADGFVWRRHPLCLSGKKQRQQQHQETFGKGYNAAHSPSLDACCRRWWLKWEPQSFLSVNLHISFSQTRAVAWHGHRHGTDRNWNNTIRWTLQQHLLRVNCEFKRSSKWQQVTTQCFDWTPRDLINQVLWINNITSRRITTNTSWIVQFSWSLNGAKIGINRVLSSGVYAIPVR